MQEVITSDEKNFLIIGIGINIVSNPNLNSYYKATNLFSETRKKPPIPELINLLIDSYSNFFYNLDNYNFINFKNRI